MKFFNMLSKIIAKNTLGDVGPTLSRKTKTTKFPNIENLPLTNLLKRTKMRTICNQNSYGESIRSIQMSSLEAGREPLSNAFFNILLTIKAIE